MSTASLRFRTVILDADSTLTSLEGIDWLASQRGPSVEREVRGYTDAAMRGEISLESVYAMRLQKVRPSRSELAALGAAYCATVATDAVRVIEAGRAAGVRWIIVSGGLRTPLLRLAKLLGIPEEDVHAVNVSVLANGTYAGFDEASPLSRQGGKPALVRSLGPLEHPILAVGDGQTDAELRSVVDEFWAYTEFVERPSVVLRAQRAVASFNELWEGMQMKE